MALSTTGRGAADGAVEEIEDAGDVMEREMLALLEGHDREEEAPEDSEPEAEEADPAPEAEPEGEAEAAEVDGEGAEASAEAEQGPMRLDPDAEVAWVDEDGTERTFKARDLIYRTEKLHRKLAEVDREVKAKQKFDQLVEVNPEGLVMSILSAKRPELAQHFQAMLQQAQAAGHYDPMRAQAETLEWERRQFEAERQRHQAQARASQEFGEMRGRLGRDFNAQEKAAMAAVMENFRAVGRPVESLGQLYDLARRKLEMDRLTAKPKPKPAPSPTARPAARRSAAIPTLDEVYEAAMRAEGIHP